MKRIGFLALWLVATCAAIAVAWAGVSIVDDEIVAPAPATDLATAEPSAIDAPPPPSTEDERIDGGAEVAEPTPTTITALSTAEVTTTTAPAATPTTVAGPPSTSPTTTTALPGPSTTTTPSVPAQTQQFNLVGGSAAVSFSATTVTVLWANANPGFDVTIEPESPGWKVEFRSDAHRSRVDVWWANGPQHEIREEPEDN